MEVILFCNTTINPFKAIIPVILPEPQFSQVLNSPFGWKAIQENIEYGGVNRYFVH
ncbi:MAG: hypothetical protein AAGG68_00535 [Bacteroidota bacterium]